MVSKEQAFFNTLLELNYERHYNEKTVRRAQELAQQLPQYNQWPHEPRQFWNAEALCWNGRIEKEVRDTITQELSFLKGFNLDLGAGSYSYVPNSVAADFAEEMLILNNSINKVAIDLESPLPFSDHQFDSVTMVFAIGYVQHIEQLLAEAKRVLNVGGTLAIVQSAHPVLGLHHMHYKNSYGEAELKIFLKKHRLPVRSYIRSVNGRDLLFVMGKRGIQ